MPTRVVHSVGERLIRGRGGVSETFYSHMWGLRKVQQVNDAFSPHPPYIAHGITFDGTNDYLTRGADLTGNADSKLLSGSFWFKRATTGAPKQVIYDPNGSEAILFNSTNLLNITFEDAATNVILDVFSSAITDTTAWHHAMFSFDMADTAKRHLYIDDVSDLAVTTYTNDIIDFTKLNHGIGAQVGGTSKINACIADLWLAFGQYIDLSMKHNRRRFISANKKPVFLGDTGAKPTGDTPIIFFSGPVSTWHTNDGDGGGFTENGALTACASNP